MTKDRLGYREIGAYYEHLIRVGRLKPEQKLPTELELARTHGVTRTTIRRAFALLVRKGLVVKMQGRGTMVASSVERDARLQSHVTVAPFETHAHGNLVSRVDDKRYRFGYTEAVVRTLQEYGRPFRLHYCTRDPQEVDRMTRELLRQGDIGLIMFDVHQEAILDRLLATPMPVVLLDSVTYGKDVDAVLGDDRAGTKEATRYLSLIHI